MADRDYQHSRPLDVHMTTGAYSDGTVFNKGKSRYNELNIKVSTIEIIHRLHEADLIGFQKDLKEVLSGKDTYLVYGLKINLLGYLKMPPLVNLILGILITGKPSFFVMKTRMRLSTPTRPTSSKCVWLSSNTTSYWKRPLLIFSQ